MEHQKITQIVKNQSIPAERNTGEIILRYSMCFSDCACEYNSRNKKEIKYSVSHKWLASDRASQWF